MFKNIGGSEKKFLIEKWEVIDGQQRITTVFLILEYLRIVIGDIENFTIDYSTREHTAKTLKQVEEAVKICNRDDTSAFCINEKLAEDLDGYYISIATKTIDRWFLHKNYDENITSIRADFNEFRRKVYVIWFEINENATVGQSIDMFTRLNIGKIPLTSAELVKALLLCETNQRDDDKNRNQTRMANEWDQIEEKLHDDEYYHFLCCTNEQYDTRIDLLLCLNYYMDTGETVTKNDVQKVFEYYNALLVSAKASGKDAADVWKKIKELQMLLSQWFEDHELYHYIGYLISCCRYDNMSSVVTLKLISEFIKDYYNCETKIEFKDRLVGRIKDRVLLFLKSKDGIIDISDLNYSENSKQIEALLLLQNVETMRISRNKYSRFSFNNFVPTTKGEEWSLEHICPQTPESIESKKDQLEWCESVVSELNSLENVFKEHSKSRLQKARGIARELETAIESLKINENKQAIDIAKLTKQYLELGSNIGDNVNDISNLALLQRGNNSSLSNGLFASKRRKIIEFDKKGQFIPLCTHNVFLKYYNDSSTDLFFWTKKDASAYLKAIKDTLKEYLPNESEAVLL